ncbi:MAG TPA: flagellar export chaperone FliS [Phycisphaerales bacterium]|nr:flagellar export chaperone FliS [Phycisphaerales bacterium]
MPTEAPPVNAYLRTKVLTASPQELRMLLLDGALKFARQGREGLAADNPEQSFLGFSQCRNILVELINSMRPDVNPELCGRVGSLYTYLYTRLLTANLERDTAAADEVIELLEYECQTWRMLCAQIETERSAAAGPHGPAAAPGAAPTGPETLSLEG